MQIHHQLILTYVGHLGHRGHVRLVGEDWWVVVDVLHPDDELGGRFQGTARLPVSGGGHQAVLVLLLTVQGLGHVDVTCVAVDDEDGADAFALQRVLSASVASVHVCVQLRHTEQHVKQEAC